MVKKYLRHLFLLPFFNKTRISMKRLSLLIVMVFCAFASSFAQRAITGTVTGPDGSPLIGASVLVKGTSVGTVTDFDGRYALSVPDGQNSIVISYTGYESQELELGASNVINACLLYTSRCV